MYKYSTLKYKKKMGGSLIICLSQKSMKVSLVVVVVVLLFYVHGKHLRSCRDGQLT